MNNGRFPLTLPLGIAVPVPLVDRWQVAGPTRWEADVSDPDRFVRLPDEFALRELLDVDADAVADLIDTVAPMGDTPAAEAANDPHFAPVVAFLDRWWLAPEPADEPRIAGEFHFAYPLAVCQAVVEHYIAWHDGENITEAWRNLRWQTVHPAPHEVGQWQLAAPDAELPTEAEAWDYFRVALERPLTLSAAFAPIGTEMHLVASTEVAVAFQIRELVREGAPLLTCANETCGRRFVRARGGAKAGQHRTTGVKFCSPSCAQAQSQREYRRRKTAAATEAATQAQQQRRRGRRR